MKRIFSTNISLREGPGSLPECLNWRSFVVKLLSPTKTLDLRDDWKNDLLRMIILAFLFLLILVPKPASAQSTDYTVKSFKSEITVNQDTSLSVKETIRVNFLQLKHGIFRIIPIIYSANGKTIRAGLSEIEVTIEGGIPYHFETSRLGQSVKIKIGDANKTITGEKTYIIKYKISDVLQRFPDHDEIYWNVTGSEWGTAISSASAVVNSPFAKITKATCYAGKVGTQEKNCVSSEKTASFTSNIPINWGQDFTIVVGLDKNNQLIFPGPIKRISKIILDNWGYPVAFLPLLIMLFAWYKKGRDLRYLTDNVYVKPRSAEEAGGKIITTPIFARETLPMVYSPINGLTPSQVGTIIDERVDTRDIIAEIVELARLDFLQIKRVEEKKFLHTDIDYIFVRKLDKNPEKLKNYQIFLLEKLFENEIPIHDLNEILRSDKNRKSILDDKANELIAVTSLKKLENHFYAHLPKLKSLLYKNLKSESIFEGNPENVRVLWTTLAVLSHLFCGFLLFVFLNDSQNFSPLIIYVLTIFPVILLVYKMPRRTAWGHSLFRQITGLKFFIGKGKWREEIAEKHLFMEEILPLAIALNVVDRLAKDMDSLDIEPPSYLNGFTALHLGSDFNRFAMKSASALTAAPTNTGKSSWSGGSGFSGSGGGGGGGFGGGGGGSW